MGRVRVNAFSISLDGFGAGPRQTLENPLGEGGESLHPWMVATRSFRRMYGKEGGTTGIDDRFAEAAMENVGAWILGRNMYGPVRGPWPDESWRGWWGEEPPYHVPTFVLTHHARAPLEMKGGTVFHFETGGIGEALRKAKEAAGERDVRIGGGAATIRQYLEARLVDEMHLAVSPVVLGRGETLMGGLDLPALGYEVIEHVPSETAAHFVLARRG